MFRPICRRCNGRLKAPLVGYSKDNKIFVRSVFFIKPSVSIFPIMPRHRTKRKSPIRLLLHEGLITDRHLSRSSRKSWLANIMFIEPHTHTYSYTDKQPERQRYQQRNRQMDRHVAGWMSVSLTDWVGGQQSREEEQETQRHRGRENERKKQVQLLIKCTRS